MTSETVSVECTDNDKHLEDREVIYEGTSYFDGLEEFRKVSIARPESRFILAIGTLTRARVLSDSDTDNVIRLAKGLAPVVAA